MKENMQQAPIFKSPSKDGTLIVDETNISVMTSLYNTVVWSIPRNSVTSIVQKSGLIAAEVEIHSAYGIHIVKMLTKPKANEFVTLVRPISPQIQPKQPQAKPPQVPIQAEPLQVPIQANPGTPIDAEIQRIKLEIQQVRLQLSQVNTEMSNIRSHYQQRHVHGGGQVGGVMRAFQQGSKDGKLKAQQPKKESLQREKLALEQQLTHLKMLKAQGTKYITPSRKAK